MHRQTRNRAGAAGRGVHDAADHLREADGFPGVDVEDAAGVGVLLNCALAQQQLGAGHRVDVGCHRHRQSQGTRQDGTDRGLRPTEPGVVNLTRGAVHRAADSHPNPQRPAAMPTAQVAVGAISQCGQRRCLWTAGGGCLDGVESAPEQVGGHDAGGPGADVDAEGQEGLVVDLNRDPWPPDRTGGGEIRALPQQLRLEQGTDMSIDRSDGQPAQFGDHVAGHRPALTHRVENQGGRGIGKTQRRGNDVGAGSTRMRPDAGGARGDDACSHGMCPCQKSGR